MKKNNVVITGLGFITSIGNDIESVCDSLVNLKNGIELYPQFADDKIPVKCVGTVKHFDTDSTTPKTGRIRPNTACAATFCARFPRTGFTLTAQ